MSQVSGCWALLLLSLVLRLTLGMARLVTSSLEARLCIDAVFIYFRSISSLVIMAFSFTRMFLFDLDINHLLWE